MFLSSLAAIAFWLLAFLLITGLYKLYNYVMATFVGRVQDDLFEYVNPIEQDNIYLFYLDQFFHRM